MTEVGMAEVYTGMYLKGSPVLYILTANAGLFGRYQYTQKNSRIAVCDAAILPLFSGYWRELI